MTTVSIIVPTRNRWDTLEHTLQTLAAIDDDRLEIVVSDNYSEDATRDVVTAVRDPRLRYFNTGRRLGMSQNWEFALSHAAGEWIGYLGDDDGLLSCALDRLREIIAATKVEAVRSTFCNYCWPQLSKYGHGVLTVPVERKVEVRNYRNELDHVLAGTKSYIALPCLYNGGFASRRLIEQVRGGSGSFFRSRIPDVYSAVVLGQCTDRFAYSHLPFAVNGASIHSTGTSTFARSPSVKTNSPGRVFLREENLPFHPAIPLNADDSLPKSISALVFESLYQAKEVFPSAPMIPPQAQLETIFATTADLDEILPWARLFGELHGVDLEQARVRTAHRRRKLKLLRMAQLAWSPQWHAGFAPDRQIDNVAQATRLASEIVARPPSASLLPLRNLVRIGERTLRSFVGLKTSAPNGIRT